MSTDSSPPFSWHFSLGRIPVVIEPSFWLVTALFGMVGARGVPQILSWVGVCFVSILIHELGHALVSMSLGSGWASIRLYSMGGLCYHQGLSRWRSVAVAAAGPLAGFLFGGIILAVNHLAPPRSLMTFVIFRDLMWVNFGWGIINLLPVPPLDGGHVAGGVLGPTRQRIALWLGIITSAGVVLLALSSRMFYAAFMFGFMGYGCYQALSTTRDLKPLKPVKVAELEPDALARAWQALRSGNETEAARLGHLALSAAKPGPESNAARDLLAWVSLTEGNARAAVSHLEKVEPPQAARPFSLAMAFNALGMPDRALPHALAAVEKEPSDQAAALSVRLLTKAQRLDEAERIAREFAWKTPAMRNARLADVASARGDFGAAAEFYATAFEAAGRAEDAYQSACHYARAGHVERATDLLERALKAGYDDFEALGQEPALAEVRSVPAIAEQLAQRSRGAA
ncbi:M50 family metallopeptidase [Archangium sp.]|jgi:Zn-dependent protease|uniref:M50 family metallopeptidase n=1 Tax=Archangium sp. TaxID=1872627 RepID=UPI002ED949D5